MMDEINVSLEFYVIIEYLCNKKDGFSQAYKLYGMECLAIMKQYMNKIWSCQNAYIKMDVWPY